MDVLDIDGEKIGKCGETLGDYFNVDAGFLGTTEYYVPFSAIGNVNDDQIFLNVRKDAVDSMGWRERPTTTRTTAHGSDRQTGCNFARRSSRRARRALKPAACNSARRSSRRSRHSRCP